jgi:hypothetical protein
VGSSLVFKEESMSSAAKLAANRTNAIRSTGPSDTSRTRFNSLAHGLASKQTIIRGEDQNEYDAFSANLLHQLAPGSTTEHVLGERIVAAAWRLKRFTRVESSFFNNRIEAYLEANPDGDPDAALANLFSDPSEMARMRLFLRYQTRVQREYDKATQEFRKAQSERLSHTLEDTYRDLLFAKAQTRPVAAASAGVELPSQANVPSPGELNALASRPNSESRLNKAFVA